MTQTFLFFLACSTRNRVLAMIRRLRQPKYLAFAVAGLGYLYLVFFRQFLSRPRSGRGLPVALDLQAMPIVETGLALLLFGFVLLPWIWPGRGSDGLRFTEAEIQFLFPAPVSRRALLHFRLAKMQLGILFGVLISFVFLGRGRIVPHPAYALVTIWMVYSFLALYYLATSLVQLSLAQHGVSGIKRQGWALAVLAGIVCSMVVWLEWFIPVLPEAGAGNLAGYSAWLIRFTEAGPAFYFLFPFKALVRPAFAPGDASFALRLMPALAILGAAYLWVMRTDVSFEEASLEKAGKTARMLEAARSGGLRSARRSTPSAAKPWFALAPVGFPPTAIFWKNMTAIRRLGTLAVLPTIAVVGIGMAVVFGRSARGDVAPMIIGSLAGVMAGFLTLFGPTLIRDDLRTDLLQIDVLKTYPLPGWGVVLGEVLVPAVFLAVAEWILVLIAAGVIPSIGPIHPSVSQRFLIGISVALLLPCFTLMGVLIQNAAVLILPGWVPLGKERQRGIEAMGQNLITMLATVIVLVVTVVPAGLLFSLMFIPGYLAGLGMLVLPAASLLAALVMLAEGGIAVFWLGRVYDRFDVSL